LKCLDKGINFIVKIAALEKIPKPLMAVLEKLPDSYLVGGCVRDMMLGLKPSDFDTEVFGVTYTELKDKVSKFGRAELVGNSFGTLKLWIPGEPKEFDFALPRQESKQGQGHKGFDVIHRSDMTMREAAIRRDFTVNAMYLDPRTGRVVDQFGGQDDLDHRILRHISPAFSEDPLRVLRAMRFSSRFNMDVHPETVKFCHSIRETFPELSKPRLWGEWSRWAEQATHPAKGLHFLKECGWIEHFPELSNLAGLLQDGEHHPEGDVWVHTCHVCNALAELPEWQTAPADRRIALMFAALTHDLGKIEATETLPTGKIISYGHDEKGVPLADNFLQRIGSPNQVREWVAPLVRNHMAMNTQPTEKWVRRLAVKVVPASLDDLLIIMTADRFGRPPKPKIHRPEMLQVREIAANLKIEKEAPKPMIQGRDLIARGMPPGPRIGEILEQAFEAQLNGEFSSKETADAWLSNTLKPTPTIEIE
jgi:tRNA nucleotidyltransferase (CCA-adding enzyme)